MNSSHISSLNIEIKSELKDSFIADLNSKLSIKKPQQRPRKRLNYSIVLLIIILISFLSIILLSYSLIKYIINLHKQNKSYQSDLNAFLSQKELSDDMIHEMTLQAQSSSLTIKTLNENINDLSFQLNAKEELIKGLNTQIGEYSKNMNHLDAMNMQYEQRIHELKLLLQEANYQVNGDSNNPSISQLKDELMLMGKTLENKDKEIDNYKRLASRDNKGSESYESNIMLLRLKYDRDIKGYNERIKELEDNVNKLRSTNTFLVNANQQHKDNMIILRKTIDQFSHNVKRNVDWGCNDDSTKKIRAQFVVLEDKLGTLT